MRFFHRFKSINYRFFCLVNGHVLKCEKKQEFTKAIKYLSKYEYAIDQKNMFEPSDKYKDKIWQCWFQGREKMPEIVKVCTNSVKKYHKDEIIFLDNSNFNDYIEIPDYIIEKHKKGIIPYANFSDMLRLSLLAKYGGCWVDSTIYLTEKIPDEILSADFFTFKSLKSNLLKNIKDLSHFELYSNNFNSVISIESPYFIRAAANNGIINGVLNMFFEYWKYENKLIDYLMIDKLFVIAVLHNKVFKEQFLKMPEYYLENVLLLQHAQFEPYDEKIFNQIKSSSTIHKMTHKNLHRNPSNNSFLQYLLNTPILDEKLQEIEIS